MRISLNKKTILWAVPLAILAAAFIGAAWLVYSLKPVNPGNRAKVSFILPAGQSVTVTADRLEEAKLVRSSSAFLLYVGVRGVRAKLQAGSYSLSPADSVAKITAILTQGKIETNLLVVPEGKSITQITKLAEAKGITAAQFSQALRAKHTQSFLKGIPPEVGVEGYLFPDSYQIDRQTTAANLVKSMLDNFGRQVPAKFSAALARQGFSLHQGLTLASMIEKEVNSAADRPLVAQVFMARLRLGMALESDVTVEYAAAKLGAEFNTTLDSPYNTYLHAGLPPGPISSPGLAALEAVAKPAKTDYLYFVTGRDGKTRFARNFSEHQQNIAKFGLAAK